MTVPPSDFRLFGFSVVGSVFPTVVIEPPCCSCGAVVVGEPFVAAPRHAAPSSNRAATTRRLRCSRVNGIEQLLDLVLQGAHPQRARSGFGRLGERTRPVVITV